MISAAIVALGAVVMLGAVQRPQAVGMARQGRAPVDSVDIAAELSRLLVSARPTERLFEEADRAHSLGCVRVADPLALAKFVLHDRADWPDDRIRSALEAGRRAQVTIRPAVPVYLVYLTSFVRDGNVAFRDDIYDRDDRLIRALANDAGASAARKRGGE